MSRLPASLDRALLARPRLSVISGEPDPDLARTAQLITPSVRVRDLAELAIVLDQLAARRGADAVTRTLDLFGHSTAETSQLRLGASIIDAARPSVIRVFRDLAAREVLPRLGIRAVRLLACHTASSPEGRATLCALAELLGVEVWGTRDLLYDAHYGPDGFHDMWQFLLVGAHELRVAMPNDERGASRALDLDDLPASQLARVAWPTRIATADVAREVLRLLDRAAGAELLGVSAEPRCALALPVAASGQFHVADVLLDGGFVRFYPDGHPGIAYPVRDPRQLIGIVDSLPSAITA